MGKVKKFCKKLERLVRDEETLTLWGVDYVPERLAVVKTVYIGDGLGHTECTECGRTVGPNFAYCPWCGRRFVGNAAVFDTRDES